MSVLWRESLANLREQFRSLRGTQTFAAILLDCPPGPPVPAPLQGFGPDRYIAGGEGSRWHESSGKPRSRYHWLIGNECFSGLEDSDKALFTKFKTLEQSWRRLSGSGIEILRGAPDHIRGLVNTNSLELGKWLFAVFDLAISRQSGSPLKADRLLWFDGPPDPHFGGAHNPLQYKFPVDCWPDDRDVMTAGAPVHLRESIRQLPTESTPAWYALLDDVIAASADAIDILLSPSEPSGEELTVAEFADIAKVSERTAGRRKQQGLKLTLAEARRMRDAKTSVARSQKTESNESVERKFRDFE